MKKSQANRFFQRLDPGLLAVIAVCLLAIWPFVSRSALPQATDAELHIFRLAELGRLVRAGELFPRWAPNFYYGYGYPIFNYYAPLAYYAGLIPELLPFWDAVDAVKLVFVLGVFAGGIGVYGFTARNWGRMPGLVASATYVYSPFVLFVDPHARGDLAESLSFAIFPLAVWAMDRLRSGPGALSWLLAASLVSLVVLSHNLMALVFAAILAGWCLWMHVFSTVPMLEAGRNRTLRRLLSVRLFLALLVGIGIAAFFWLTVVLERNAVNLGTLIGQGDNFDFRTHFLSVSELISPAKIMDWSATEPVYALGLGTVQALLGAVGVIALLMGRAQGKIQASFFAVATAVLLFMMLPVSRLLWESVPGLPFLQFPWRLLGPAAFTIAVLSAAGVAAMMDLAALRVGSWLAPTLVALILISSLPLIQVPPWPQEFGPTSALRVLEEELAGRWLGTTSTSDFVPATVDKVPRPTDSLVEDFKAGRTLDRVNRKTLPEDTVVSSDEITPLHFRYLIESTIDFPLRLFLFEFPGWDVTIDGQVAERELGRPEGFIVVPVTAGEHVVEVEFGDTADRRLAYLVSGLSLVITMGYALYLRRHHDLLPSGEEEIPVSRQGVAKGLVAVAAVAILITGINALLSVQQGWLRFESPPLMAIPAKYDQYADLDGQVALIGYDVPGTGVAGDELSLTIYWQAIRPIATNYQAFVHLLDLDGNLVAQSDALNPGDFPTENWPANKYVRDTHVLQLPANLAPGVYHWSVGLWLASEGNRLQVVDSTGQPRSDAVTLEQPLIVE